MAPYPLDMALAELAKNRRMWATNPALTEDRTGLESVMYQTQLWLQVEYARAPEGPQRDDAVKRKLKAVEKELEEHVGILITWESLHKRAIHLFDTLPNVTEQFKVNGLAQVDAHADRVRKETSLVKLRAALEQRKQAVEGLEKAWNRQHEALLFAPEPFGHAHTWSLAKADRREVLLTRGRRREGRHAAYVTSRQADRYGLRG
ncbi:hypothetical protein BCR35DRAFT_351063 [Leucosporidium creatinivorum]|uniref:Uncharacterized protein n=1 Tax=Leucosporidium creatinivorum TaxID=106004 RepID=A0A1Y2FW79_9BASI|nr:hypothetical protein BCR35DRAFT_351063 [Leucosporidium creatinivorum]